MNKVEMITDLLNELNGLEPLDDNGLDAVKRKSLMVVKNLFGGTSSYLHDIKIISFRSAMINPDYATREYNWNNGIEKLRNILLTIIEEIKLFEVGSSVTEKTTKKTEKASNSNIFVVHGRENLMKESTARAVEKLGFNPIILHEQENKGRTIIEKFTDYSDVGFAIVLLSGDDIGGLNVEDTELRPRARQNVIFELGYFIGKLGREKVVALYSDMPDFEIPSDYAGVLFTEFDSRGMWKFELAKELKAAGYKIDMNLI